MVLRWLVVALAIGAALPAAAMAIDKGVILDRGSPVEKEYSLPLEAERVGLSGLTDSVLRTGAVRAGIAAPGSGTAPGPLFGLGVQSPAARRAALRSDLEARVQGSDGVLAGTMPAAKRAALIAAGRVASRVGDGGPLDGGGGLAAAVVLVAGALAGLVMRRFRLV